MNHYYIMKDQNTIDNIMTAVGGDILSLTVGKILKSGQKDAFIPKGVFRKKYGLGAAVGNRVHFALKRMWGSAKAAAERKAVNKGNLVLESTKHCSNGKVVHTYAPLVAPKAGKRGARKTTTVKKSFGSVIKLVASDMGVDVGELRTMLKAA